MWNIPMDLSQAFDLVRTVIAQEFKIDVLHVTQETVASDVAGWDSFSHCNLIMSLESRIGCVLPFDELMEAGNVGELSQIVRRAVA
jgi:acyl carrier protein